MKTIIIDASVIIKAYIEEPDTQEALDFIEACISNHCLLKAPNLLQYEVADVAMRIQDDIDRFGGFMVTYIDGLIGQVSPSLEAWAIADSMTRTGHEKSGYPSLYGSIYHALAIAEKGIFVTADQRYYEKAKSFGHIVMLENWDNIFSEQEE